MRTMNLQPFVHHGDVSESEFWQLLSHRLGDSFDRALHVFRRLGTIHSYKVANLLHLSLQKGIEDKALDALEEWCDVVKMAPDIVAAHVNTMLFFDVAYADFFMRGDCTIAGIGLEIDNNLGLITLRLS